MARRLGAGGTAIIVVVALSSGGVAAALTGNLPDPVQEFAHTVIGAPAPETPTVKRAASPAIKPLPDRETTAPPLDPSPSPVESSDAGEPPSDNPADPGKSRSAAEPEASAPAAAPSRGPKDEPSQGPKPPPRPVPASLTMSASSHLTSYGATLTLVGRVTAGDGSPVPSRKVVLQVRGSNGWQRVLRTTSDASGTVTAPTSPVTGLDRYRWHMRTPLRSTVWRVRVKPEVSASYVVNERRTIVTVSTTGALPGDLMSVYLRMKKQPTLVGEVRVSADGTARFSLPTPERRRALAIRLERTRDHAPARTKLVIVPPA